MRRFRSSFQLRKEPHEDGTNPMDGLPYNSPLGLRAKQSRATLGAGATLERREDSPSTPRNKAMQDFFQKTGASLRRTSTSLKAQGASFRARSAKLGEKRIPRRKTKVVCVGLPCVRRKYAYRSSRPDRRLIATAGSRSKPSI